MNAFTNCALAALLAGTASLLSGCATHPDEVKAAFVPVSKYQAYNCEQLAAETHRIVERTVDLYGHIAERNGEKSEQFVLNSLTYPGIAYMFAEAVLMPGKGRKAEEELARLKGDFESLRQNALRRNCEFAVLPADKTETRSERTGVASKLSG